MYNQLVLKKILTLGIILLLGYGIIQAITPDKWTLMLCNDVMEDGVQCFNNFAEYSNIESKEVCFQTGNSFVASGKAKTFECGLSCKKRDYGMNVCDEICNLSGCTK